MAGLKYMTNAEFIGALKNSEEIAIILMGWILWDEEIDDDGVSV